MARDVSEYVIDGDRFPSVTEILEAVGVCDLSDIPREALENASRRGKLVHSWIELEGLGHLSPGAEPDSEIAPYIRAFHRFVEETGFEIEDQEVVVVSRTHRYAGTLDLAGRYGKGKLKGIRGVVDLKAAVQIQPWTRLQIMGYALAFEEMEEFAGAPYQELSRSSLQLRADGHYRLQPYPDRGLDLLDWCAAVRLTHWQIRHGQLVLDL